MLARLGPGTRAALRHLRHANSSHSWPALCSTDRSWRRQRASRERPLSRTRKWAIINKKNKKTHGGTSIIMMMITITGKRREKERKRIAPQQRKLYRSKWGVCVSGGKSRPQEGLREWGSRDGKYLSGYIDPFYIIIYARSWCRWVRHCGNWFFLSVGFSGILLWVRMRESRKLLITVTGSFDPSALTFFFFLIKETHYVS